MTSKIPHRCSARTMILQRRLWMMCVGLKIGIPRDYFGDGLDPEVKDSGS